MMNLYNVRVKRCSWKDDIDVYSIVARSATKALETAHAHIWADRRERMPDIRSVDFMQSIHRVQK